MTSDAARAHRAHRTLTQAGVEVSPGLTDQQLDEAEEACEVRFGATHRAFLRIGLPSGQGWPDWRGGSGFADVRRRIDASVDGVLFDVGADGFWLDAWGERPDDAQAAELLVREHLAEAPRLVPLYGHRFLPPAPYRDVVLSVHQTDVIVYGADLARWAIAEFHRSARTPDRAPTPGPQVRFWESDLVGVDQEQQA